MILAIQITLWINIIALAIGLVLEVPGIVEKNKTLLQHISSIAGSIWLIFVFLKVMNIV